MKNLLFAKNDDFELSPQDVLPRFSFCTPKWNDDMSRVGCFGEMTVLSKMASFENAPKRGVHYFGVILA